MNKQRVSMKKLHYSMKICLREVDQKDCDLIYNWANDENVRRNSFFQDKIIYTDHINWFNKKINEPNNYFYILVNDEGDVGTVRLDIENQIGTISYSISRLYRGKQYGTIIIEELEKKIEECRIDIHSLYAEVKYTNVASQKIFKKLGFKEYEFQEKIVYKKEL